MVDLIGLIAIPLSWARDKYLEVVRPFRVDYNDTFLRIEVLPWAEISGQVGVVFGLFTVVFLFYARWEEGLIFVLLGVFPIVGMFTLLRKTRLIIQANKPQAWIKVIKKGILGEKSALIKVEKLQGFSYELKSDPHFADLFVTAAGETTAIAKGEDSVSVQTIHAYLNGFFFGEDVLDWEPQADGDKSITLEGL
jgi:hypothetical protein